MSSISEVKNAIASDQYKLDGDLYSEFRKQTDATIDQWLANNYDSLKEYKHLGPIAAKSAMVSNQNDNDNEVGSREVGDKKGGIAAKYGLNLDRNAADYWQKLSPQQFKRVAANAGYKDPKVLWDALIEEDLAHDRQKIFEDFKKEHPIVNFLAESFFPNTYEGTKRIVQSGQGDVTDLIDDVAEDFVISTASSLNPVGKVTRFGTMGKVIMQGVYSGAMSFANEALQSYNYDKQIDPRAIAFGTGLGAGGEFISSKKVGNALNNLFPENPTMKKASKKIENIFGDVSAEANDYKKGLEEKVRIYNDPTNNPASPHYKRTADNALNEGVTEEQFKNAIEGLKLFDYVKNGKKKPPVKETKVIARIDPKTGVSSVGEPIYFTEDEIAKAFMNHPQINKLDAMIDNMPKGFFKKTAHTVPNAIFQTGRTGFVGGSNAAMTLEKDAKSTEEKALKKSEDPKYIAKWESGYAPMSGADNDWPAFVAWGKKNPKNMGKALAATKKRLDDEERKRAEEAYAVDDFRYAGIDY